MRFQIYWLGVGDNSQWNWLQPIKQAGPAAVVVNLTGLCHIKQNKHVFTRPASQNGHGCYCNNRILIGSIHPS